MSWESKLCKECRECLRNLHETLLECAKNCCANCVKILIESGADVNRQDYKGKTALMITLGHWGNAECVKTLIESGADVNMASLDGRTALMVAGMFDDAKNVKLLIEAGADLNAQDEEGHTALLHATQEAEYTKSARILVAAGADVNIVNEFDEYVFLYAGQHVKFVKDIIKAGADVNFRGKDGNSYLMLSVYAEHTNCVRVLLRAGAKINLHAFVDNQNALQRHIAGMDGWVHGPNKTMVMLLYAAGETIDGTTVEGRDPNTGSSKQVPVPDYLLHEDLKLDLKHLCRDTIRKHLLKIDLHQHLFGRIPHLGLPECITDYLLYNVSLKEEDDEE